MDFPETKQPFPQLPGKTLYQGKLIIFTGFYQSVAHARYTQSLIETSMVLERLGIRWDYWPICGDFHFDRALNNALLRFIEDKDATDLLIIDSDESWDVMGVLRLISHKEEVVACAYRMKNRWEDYTCRLKGEGGVPIGKMLPDGTALLAADKVPGGFLRIKKSALLKYIEAYPDDWYWMGERKVPAFFQSAIRDHQYYSHDYNLAENWKAAGVELWIDPNVSISHYGTTEYPGNLDQFLRAAIPGAAQEEREQAAFKTVKAMAV